MIKYFTKEEFERSQIAIDKGIDNTIPPKYMKNLYNLMNELEYIREHFGKPVIISSGYRSPELNKLVKGSKNSQHCKGEAADFTVKGVSVQEVFDWIKNNCEYHEVINEFDEWVHLGVKITGNKRESFKAQKVGRITTY